MLAYCTVLTLAVGCRHRGLGSEPHVILEIMPSMLPTTSTRASDNHTNLLTAGASCRTLRHQQPKMGKSRSLHWRDPRNNDPDSPSRDGGTTHGKAPCSSGAGIRECSLLLPLREATVNQGGGIGSGDGYSTVPGQVNSYSDGHFAESEGRSRTTQYRIDLRRSNFGMQPEMARVSNGVLDGTRPQHNSMRSRGMDMMAPPNLWPHRRKLWASGRESPEHRSVRTCSRDAEPAPSFIGCSFPR